MLLQLIKTDSTQLGLNRDTIWKVVETSAGCTVYIGGNNSYNLSTSYADVLTLGGGAFKEYDTIVAGQTVTFALNLAAIARVTRESGKTWLFLKTGDKIRVDSAFDAVFAPAAAELTGAERIMVVQNGELVEITIQDIADLGGGGGEIAIEHTVAEMQTLAGAAELTVGQLYKITGYTDAGTVLYFRAATTSQLETNGIRTMLCPAYYGTGENNGDGNNWIGVWASTKSPATGDLAIWGGKVYRNFTGAVGTANTDVALDETNWEEVGKGSFSANEYVEMSFGCSYDLANNWISKQWDSKNNTFGLEYDAEDDWWGLNYNPCDVSDWNHAEQPNGLLHSNICIAVWNNTCNKIFGNTIIEGYIKNNTCAGPIWSNMIVNGVITGNSNTSDIYENVCEGIINNSNTGSISKNRCIVVVNNTNAGSIGDNRNNGLISNNSNAGYITMNKNNGNIAGNSNVGNIYMNDNNGAISGCSSGITACNIQNNTNNGNITGAYVANVTDTIINK